MALLNRADWYDWARSTSWTPKYVTKEKLVREEQGAPLSLPLYLLWYGSSLS